MLDDRMKEIPKEVIYTSGRLGDEQDSPLYDGKFGKVVGNVIEICSDYDPLSGISFVRLIKVRWTHNNYSNYYLPNDLSPAYLSNPNSKIRIAL